MLNQRIANLAWPLVQRPNEPSDNWLCNSIKWWYDVGRRMMIERLFLFARPFSSVALMVFSTKGVPDDEVEVPVHYCNNQHLHRDSALCKMY